MPGSFGEYWDKTTHFLLTNTYRQKLHILKINLKSIELSLYLCESILNMKFKVMGHSINLIKIKAGLSNNGIIILKKINMN